MNPLAEQRDVEVDDVTVLEWATIGDTVADHLVDRTAHRLGEGHDRARVLQWAGIGIEFDRCVVTGGVDLVGGDTRLAKCAEKGQDIGGVPAGAPHPFDDVGRLHPGFVPAIGVTVVGPGRLDDRVGDRAQGGDVPGLNR